MKPSMRRSLGTRMWWGDLHRLILPHPDCGATRHVQAVDGTRPSTTTPFTLRSGGPRSSDPGGEDYEAPSAEPAPHQIARGAGLPSLWILSPRGAGMTLFQTEPDGNPLLHSLTCQLFRHAPGISPATTPVRQLWARSLLCPAAHP